MGEGGGESGEGWEKKIGSPPKMTSSNILKSILEVVKAVSKKRGHPATAAVPYI